MAIDILKAFEQPPQALDFVLPGFLAGSVGAMVAPGATGKSFWALEAAMAVACAVAGGDVLQINPSQPGRVIYLPGEDPATVIEHRLHSLGGHLTLAARKDIAANLVIEPVTGKRLDIMRESHLRRVIEYCTGSRLLVFDTLSRIHTLDENSNGQMALLVSTLEYIAAQTGASILYLHHVSKASARDGGGDQQQAARGASSLIDNARWCSFVQKMTEAEAEKHGIDEDRRGFFIRYGCSKQNYGLPMPDKWLERKAGGVLVPVELKEARNGKGKKRGGDDDDNW